MYRQIFEVWKQGNETFMILFLAFKYFAEWYATSPTPHPQPGESGNLCSTFSSSSLWQVNVFLQGSRCYFGPPRVLYFPGTRQIWWAFYYRPPGEAPDGRTAVYIYRQTIFTLFKADLSDKNMFNLKISAAYHCCYQDIYWNTFYH